MRVWYVYDYIFGQKMRLVYNNIKYLVFFIKIQASSIVNKQKMWN